MSAANSGPLVAAPVSPPPIRGRWPGLNGIYAGIAAGVDGAPDCHLVLLDDKPADRMNWKDAMAWAKSMDADLPTRDESALLYAHLRDEFEGGWHWTGTQYSSYLAWNQHFTSGSQFNSFKEFEARARLVRRLPLQSFSPSVDVA